MSYREKYLKYKTKYLELKQLIGGTNENIIKTTAYEALSTAAHKSLYFKCTPDKFNAKVIKNLSADNFKDIFKEFTTPETNYVKVSYFIDLLKQNPDKAIINKLKKLNIDSVALNNELNRFACTKTCTYK